VARLIALSPCAGLLPVAIGGVTLTEADPGPVTSLAPFAGQEGAVDAVLRGAFGFGFPAPNTMAAGGGARVLWAGRGRALLCGAAPDPALAGLAALVDLSDAFAWVSVAGPAAGAVLARLVPIDLRQGAFPDGATARTLVNHMTAQVTRTGPDAFELAVMRSMARTLVHELSAAARGVAARGAAARGGAGEAAPLPLPDPR
jgi:sarcosine oxidase subunit gamma